VYKDTGNIEITNPQLDSIIVNYGNNVIWPVDGNSICIQIDTLGEDKFKVYICKPRPQSCAYCIGETYVDKFKVYILTQDPLPDFIKIKSAYNCDEEKFKAFWKAIRNGGYIYSRGEFTSSLDWRYIYEHGKFTKEFDY